MVVLYFDLYLVVGEIGHLCVYVYYHEMICLLI